MVRDCQFTHAERQPLTTVFELTRVKHDPPVPVGHVEVEKKLK